MVRLTVPPLPLPVREGRTASAHENARATLAHEARR
jgi:hypothetical protein